MAMAFATRCYVPLGMRDKNYQPERGWSVGVHREGDAIEVFPKKDGWREGSKSTKIKAKDSLVSNLLCITWESRVQGAIEKWQRYANEMNEQDQHLDYLESKFKEGAAR